ncbi:MAG: HlyD family efflux transporter periplasmic adaptor subunit [Chloroflexi bacterium]|nr:HlyD family efflux transporter periplasmic adaptor subunit [Chloroflexota bacterium]
MSRLKLVLVLLLVLLIGASLVAHQRGVLATKPAAPTPKYVSVVVKTGTVIVTAKANGAIATPIPDIVTAPVAATLTKILVVPGQQVQAGQSIGTMSTAALDTAVTQAQLTLTAAQSKLAALQAGPRPETVMQAQAAITQAQATLASDQAKLAALQAGPRRQTLIQAQAPVAQTQATLASDQAKLAALQAGPRLQVVAQAQAKVAQAQATLNADQQKATGTIAGLQAALTGAQKKLAATPQNARLATAQAQTDVQKAKDALFAAQTSRDGTCGNPTKPAYQCQGANAQVNSATDSLAAARTKRAQVTAQTKAMLASDQTAVDQAAAVLKQAQQAQAATLTQDQTAVMAAVAALSLAQHPYTTTDLQQAQAAVANDEAAVNAAQAGLSLAQHPYTATDIQQAQAVVTHDQAAVTAAQAALSLAQHPYTAADVQQAQATVAQATAALQVAQALRQQAKLVSPVSGVVITTPTAAGSYVKAGASVATIAPLGVSIASVNVSEFDVRTMALHDAATVKVDGFPGRKFKGTVTSIAVLPVTLQGVVFYPVSVTLQNPKHLVLRPGMSLRATITTQVRSNVKVLPTAAIGQQQGTEAVQVPVVGKQPTWKLVQVGAQNGRWTEIQSGLPLGATVLIAQSAAAGVPPGGGASATATPAGAPPGIGVPKSSGGQQGQH